MTPDVDPRAIAAAAVAYQERMAAAGIAVSADVAVRRVLAVLSRAAAALPKGATGRRVPLEVPGGTIFGWEVKL